MASVKIFVSYAREDRRWFEQPCNLIGSISSSLKKRGVVVFDDSQIIGGDRYKPWILAKINEADIVILLISRDFLASEFILTVELPRIKERADKGKLIVMPILVGHCPWHELALLQQRQVLPRSTEPLINYLDKIAQWDKVRDEIIKEFENRILNLEKERPIFWSSARKWIAFALAVGLIALALYGVVLRTHTGTEDRTTKVRNARAELTVAFQRKDQVGYYQTLTADAVPLRTGDRIQIQAKLPKPLYAYVFIANSNGAAKLLRPETQKDVVAATEIRIPGSRDEWLELEPPPGTETVLLMCRRQPVRDVDTILQQLRLLGPPPKLTTSGLFSYDETGEHFSGDLSGIEKGFLDALLAHNMEGWEIIRVLVFPHVAREKGR